MSTVEGYNEKLTRLLHPNALANGLVVRINAYDANGNLEYTGFALAGASKAAAVWRIYKRVYDANDQFSYDAWSKNLVAWDNRATATYVSNVA